MAENKRFPWKKLLWWLIPAVFAAVCYRQHTFSKNGGHAEQGGEFHPHQRARAASHQGGGHAYDISRADGGRQCGHQGRKGRDAVGFRATGVLSQRGAEGKAQTPPGQKAHPKCQKGTGAQQQSQCSRAPQQIIDGVQHSVYPLCPTQRYAEMRKKIPAAADAAAGREGITN